MLTEGHPGRKSGSRSRVNPSTPEALFTELDPRQQHATQARADRHATEMERAPQQQPTRAAKFLTTGTSEA